jgi:hypothetical protein
MTTPESRSVSLTPSWMSSFPRNMGCPPMAAMAASVETRVRVDRLLKDMAMVLPRSADRSDSDWVPALMAALWAAAFCTRVANSEGVRSPIVSRWRGADGAVE